MGKTLLYRLFGIGKIPPAVRAELKPEGILVEDEGIPGTVTYRNFRAPHRYAALRKQWCTASIVLTRERLFGLQYTSTIINVPLADERIRQMEFSLEEDAALLCVRFDAGLFRADWSGTIEYRFKTPEARRLLELIKMEIGN